MVQIRPDAIVYSSLMEAYINYDTVPGVIAIPSFLLTSGGSAPYQTVIPYTRGGTRADVYLEGNGFKIPASSGPRIAAKTPTYTVYQFAGGEIVEVFVRYSSAAITVTLVISNNSGSDINLIAQNITASAVMYDAPIAPV